MNDSQAMVAQSAKLADEQLKRVAFSHEHRTAKSIYSLIDRGRQEAEALRAALANERRVVQQLKSVLRECLEMHQQNDEWRAYNPESWQAQLEKLTEAAKQ